MVIELRKVGLWIVLYTDAPDLCKSLALSSDVVRRIPYRRNGRLLGFDHYFERMSKHRLNRIAKGQLLLDLPVSDYSRTI